MVFADILFKNLLKDQHENLNGLPHWSALEKRYLLPGWTLKEWYLVLELRQCYLNFTLCLKCVSPSGISTEICLVWHIKPLPNQIFKERGNIRDLLLSMVYYLMHLNALYLLSCVNYATAFVWQKWQHQMYSKCFHMSSKRTLRLNS